MDIIETKKTNIDSESELSHKDNEKDFHHFAYDETENLIYLQKGKEYERKDYQRGILDLDAVCEEVADKEQGQKAEDEEKIGKNHIDCFRK